MSERNNIQLAIGYGLGVGMVLGGILVVAVRFVASLLDVGIGVFAISAVIIVGGVAIAIYNALKLDRGGDLDHRGFVRMTSDGPASE